MSTLDPQPQNIQLAEEQIEDPAPVIAVPVAEQNGSPALEIALPADEQNESPAMVTAIPVADQNGSPEPVIAKPVDELNESPVMAKSGDENTETLVKPVDEHNESSAPIITETVDEQNENPPLVIAETADEPNESAVPVITESGDESNDGFVLELSKSADESNENLVPEISEPVDESNKSPVPEITKSIDENEMKVKYTQDSAVDENKSEELAAKMPFNGIDEPRKELKNLNMPSLEFSDNDFNSTDSDSFAGRPQKNRTLEMRLSALIEKACSSDVEAEQPSQMKPTLPATNVTVTLPNNQVLFTVEGVVPTEVNNDLTDPEMAVLPAEMAKNFAPPRRKKYMYKLKSKGGAVLKYTSYVPVVLKKPRINLTRIDLEAMFGVEAKKKRAKRKTSSSSSPVNGKRSKSRLPKTSLPPEPVDDASDAIAVKPNEETNSSFGMQTRKRKLKFLPDGRMLCIAKRKRSSSSSSASSISDGGDDPPAKESTDEDWQASGEELKKLKVLPEEKETTTVKRKSAPNSQTPKSAKLVTPRSAKVANNGGKAVVANNAASKRIVTAPKSSPSNSVVNPAQLLSTLLGVTIRPSQLNTVRFKPKTIQKQHPSLQKTIVLTGEELKGVAASFRNSVASNAATPKPNAKTPKPSAVTPKPNVGTPKPKVATPKPMMQKILPRSSLTAVFNKTVDTKPSPPTPSILSRALRRDLVSPPAAPPIEELPCEVPSFDDFTDSRTVRTKAGPKKFLMQKVLGESEKLNRLTVYDLVQSVFEQTPSWNLHIMPDTKTFCIAQVGRGRMGIPILRKSVELDDQFGAKIFVHQLHCKKFDGVYDTEAKINSLLTDIDSLAG